MRSMLLRHRVRTMIVASLFVAVPAPAAPPMPGPIETGDPLPAREVHDASCRDEEPGATRWLDSDPHVPFAIVDRDGIRSAGAACCRVWARRGARWHAIDAYGQLAGEVAITGGEGYDATQCYELQLSAISGTEGAHLYASHGGAWHPPASARWVPSAAQQASFARFEGDVERLKVDPAVPGTDHRPLLPVGERTLFFRLPSTDADPPSATRCAVAGGHVLVIACLESGDRWTLRFVEASLAAAETPTNAYRPLAVFDMDGDGAPEVIYHWNAGDAWADVVLSAPESAWKEVAESVGGSTA